LNQATQEDLQELFLLNEWQIQALLLHRRSHGKLISIFELQSIKYWDVSTIELVLPFVSVDDKLDQIHVSAREIIKYAKAEFVLRYQVVPDEKMGFQNVSDSIRNMNNAYYFGNPDHYYTRFRYTYRTNMSVGLTAEKDPGEQFFKGTQKQGFDFYSGHLFYKGGKYVKSFNLGDFQVQIGQGLNCWTGYGFGKTADILTGKKNPVPIRPYTSADEFNFYRGAAIDVGVRNFSWLNFLSLKKLDASLEIDSNGMETNNFSSISEIGLHRTRGELNKKGVLTEYIYGTNLRYTTNTFSAGVSAIYRNYNRNFAKSSEVHNQFSSNLSKNLTIGSDYRAVLRNVNLFGELVFQPKTLAWANLHGMLISLDSKCVFSLIYRNYGRAYQVPYVNGFSESSKVQNERGLYGGIKLKLNQLWLIQGYYDFFRFPWLRYQVDGPSGGNDYLIQLLCKPSKKMEFYVRYRNEMQEENFVSVNDKLPKLGREFKQTIRFNWSIVLGDVLTLRNRIEYVYLKKSNAQIENGVLIYQDVAWKPKKLPFELFLRYALFDTGGYDSRIYAYENSAQYIYAVPSYYYEGNRFVGMAKFSFLKHIDVWLRYGVSLFEDRQSIGSGSEEILGNSKRDITLQVRLMF
jgi:hypothetical protein